MKRRELVVAMLVLGACSAGGGSKPVTAPSATVTPTVSVDAALCRDAATTVIAAGRLNKPPPKVRFDNVSFPAPGGPDRGLMEASLIECGSRGRWLNALEGGGARRDKQHLNNLYKLGCVLIRQDRISALPPDCPSN